MYKHTKDKRTNNRTSKPTLFDNISSKHDNSNQNQLTVEQYQEQMLYSILHVEHERFNKLIKMAENNNKYLKAILDYRLPDDLEKDDKNNPTAYDFVKKSTFLIIASIMNNLNAVEGILNLISNV